MGTCLSRKVAQGNGDTNWQVILFSTEPYSTLVCDGYCSTVEWGMLSVTCRPGTKLSRLRLLATVSIEKDRRRALDEVFEELENRHRAMARELNSMVDHFSRATEIFQEDAEEGHWIVGFEFHLESEAFSFCRDVVDLQRRRESGVL